VRGLWPESDSSAKMKCSCRAIALPKGRQSLRFAATSNEGKAWALQLQLSVVVKCWKAYDLFHHSAGLFDRAKWKDFNKGGEKE